MYTLDVPAYHEVTCSIEANNGDADLYLRWDQYPEPETDGQNDCGSYTEDSNETCSVGEKMIPSTLNIAVEAWSAYVGLSITCTSTPTGNETTSSPTSSPTRSPSEDNTPSTKALNFRIADVADENRGVLDIDFDADSIEFEITSGQNGSSGDADLYIKFGSPPTDSDYDCRPYMTGNFEDCVFAGEESKQGSYHYWVRAYDPFQGVDLKVSATVSSS